MEGHIDFKLGASTEYIQVNILKQVNTNVIVTKSTPTFIFDIQFASAVLVAGITYCKLTKLKGQRSRPMCIKQYSQCFCYFHKNQKCIHKCLQKILNICYM